MCAYLGHWKDREVPALWRKASNVVDLRTAHPAKELVIICDGQPNIWSIVSTSDCYPGATQVLDFCHAAEHLSQVADAIFGKARDKGCKWYHKHRSALKEADDAVHSAIRSMRYYKSTMKKGNDAFQVVRRAQNHFSRNKEPMQYAGFLGLGLPIGSGPVEAACKAVVGARLKRRGMRWTRSGGQRVLNLGVQHSSNRWDCFWRSCTEDRCAS
jgi:hypothetical protein